MNPKSFFLKSLFSLAISLIGSSLITSSANALRRDPYYYYEQTDGYTKCIDDSHRSNIYSVTNYACRKAAEKPQNACASWIGPYGDSSSNVIEASSVSEEIDIRIWGMCTYENNTSDAMDIMNNSDGGSITCDGNCNFERTGNWGEENIGSKVATLNVAKFIEHAPVAVINGETYYYRVVELRRQHGGNTSRGKDFSYIYLKVDGITPPPPPPEDSCVDWETPASYTNSNEWDGTTSVVVKVKNTATRFNYEGYGAWSDEFVYAMPTDNIAWRVCYYPGVQTTANTGVTSINETKVVDYEDLPEDKCLASGGTKESPVTGYLTVTYKKLKEAYGTAWGNFFNTSNDISDGNHIINGDPLDKHGPFGDDTGVKEVNNDSDTIGTDTGKTYTETATTSEPAQVHITSSDPKTEPACCSCCPNPPEKDEAGNDIECTGDTFDCTGCCTNKYNQPLRNAEIKRPLNAEDKAEVRIPYNYIKRTGVSIHDDVVYAGETAEISYVWTMVVPRWNDETRAAYATKTSGNTEIKLYAYVTTNESGDKDGFEIDDGNGCNVIRDDDNHKDQCAELDDTSALLNSEGKLKGDENQFFGNFSYNIFDASAGDYVCFVSSVDKEASNGNEDMKDEGNGKWAYSDPTCAIIAKRPSFQVWGGDVYSNTKIDAKTASKRNVYNNYHNLGQPFQTTSSNSTYYGSWVEQGLVFGTGGETDNFASGAAFGYNNEPGKAYGGLNLNSFDCSKIAPLTIANVGSNCGNRSNISSNFITDNQDTTNEKRRGMIAYWVGDDRPNNSEIGDGTVLNLGGDVGGSVSSATGAKIRYVYSNASNGEIKVYGKIEKGKTVLIESAGKVKITGNIKYNNSYDQNDTLETIPKVVIYAANVDISCGVKEVDAIIITKAGGTVNTCAEHEEVPEPDVQIKDENRNNQLRIFGMVMADNIILGRTYGSAAWRGLNPGETYNPAKNGQIQAAEIFDFDTSILLWSEFMASSAETDTLQVSYQQELAPRY